MIHSALQDTCPTGQDHDIDLGAGSLELDREHVYLSVPCLRCGAWATVAASIETLRWGEPESGASALP